MAPRKGKEIAKVPTPPPEDDDLRAILEAQAALSSAPNVAPPVLGTPGQEPPIADPAVAGPSAEEQPTAGPSRAASIHIPNVESSADLEALVNILRNHAIRNQEAIASVDYLDTCLTIMQDRYNELIHILIELRLAEASSPSFVYPTLSFPDLGLLLWSRLLIPWQRSFFLLDSSVSPHTSSDQFSAAPPLVARLCPIFQLHTLRSVALCAPDAAFFTAQRCVGYFLSLWLTKQKAWPCPQIFGFLTLRESF
ncbi:hypothetical protein A0H81_09001 [Grifola frondosa]|uniref:Uncharacterized protein n=1 Tax=Grifola frondosa TaxID=5627 RepID=A0A1C7M1H0_GRIFR|nr:hypothetical protein A0H81_09001 [Grifola frondosa]